MSVMKEVNCAVTSGWTAFRDTERYSPQRVKTPSAQLGGMQEGIHAITDIEYSVISRSDGSKCK